MTKENHSNQTVESLRKDNFKCKVFHYRYDKIKGELLPRNAFSDTGLMSSFGGATEISILTPNGEELKGEAVCSKKDQFNRKLGLKIAIARALKNNIPF